MTAARLDHMERIHDVQEGVLFWGGPAHEQVWALPKWQAEYVFAVPPRLNVNKPVDFDAEPVALRMGSVRYTAHRWAVPWSSGLSEEWTIYVYGDGEHRLLKNFTGTAKFVMWMADPSRWSDPEPESED